MKTSTKRALSGLAMTGAAALVLAGCAAAPAPEETEVPEVDYLACAVSDEGSWNDKSFNQSVYEGLEKANAELGVQISDAESASPDDFAPNLQAMIDASCDVTIAVGFNLVAAVNEAAAANPEANFVTVDGWSEGNANLKPINYAMNQSSYLAGYLAAAHSTTKVVGTYGGMQIPAVTDFMTGFYYGAMAWGADNGTDVTVVGWDPATEKGDFIGDFTPNSGTSKSIAAGQLAADADVIFPVGGDQFGAVSEAITEAGVAAVMIGVDKDISVTSPEYSQWMLTSVEKRMTNAVFDIIKDIAIDGNAFNGDTYLGTLENGGTALSPITNFSGDQAAIEAKLQELTDGIIAGDINPLG
ncbi:nucleoside-binding protein [Microbacteriaceae bacterium MWH-Ta3]|nr:nucleoside-binding protein [Microbacteriaceae bacterium MWH-Ta3]